MRNTTPKLNPIIQPAPVELHQQLLFTEPKETPQNYIEACKGVLQAFDLDITDTSEHIPLPVPKISEPLPDWLITQTNQVYKPYFDLINTAHKVKFPNEKSVAHISVSQNEYTPDTETTKSIYFIPPVSCHTGWSKFDVKTETWLKISTPDTDTLYFDFEARIQPNGQYLPFVCSAVSADGVWYSWIAEDFHNLPKTVSFGDKFRMGIGQNVVSYDRRYIQECYEFNHPVRMIDTFCLYFAVMGLSGDQLTTYLKFKNSDGFKPAWCNVTSQGGLQSLVEHLLDEKITKDTRDEIQECSLDYLRENLDYFWQYCCKDTRYTIDVFKLLYTDYKEMCPHPVSLAGMLERSTLRIGVVSDYYERLANVDQSIKGVRVKVNDYLTDLLKKHGQEYPQVKTCFQSWQELEAIDRLLNSVKTVDILISQCGCPFKLDKAGKKKTITLPVAERRNLARKLIAEKVLELPELKTYEQWVSSIHKKAKPEHKDIQPDSYISLAGKVAPIILQMHWQGKPMFHNGATWGINNDDGDFVSLPHPKNEVNVGTPLSKDFKAKVITGEFTSPICNLLVIFEAISTVGVWVSFRERFYKQVYIHDDIWLTDLVPVGTITERATGLCVVMPNTKEGRAGTECKQWFGVTSPTRIKVSADYASQESIIFAAHADTVFGYLGSCAASVQILAGNSDLGTDSHTTTAKLLAQYTEETPKELRQLAKSMNFANQFLCGKNKLSSMMYLAFKGKKTTQECDEIAVKFIDSSRGYQNYGKYENGLGSNGFNRLKELTRQDVQRSQILKRAIPKPLQERYCGRDFMTTRFNFNIQETGQELVNICLVTVRILSQVFGIPYNIAMLVHDEIHLECENNVRGDIAWMMQIGHLFSKVLLYHEFKINTFPQNGIWFESVEFDHSFRKSPTDPGVTPSNPKANTAGFVCKAKDCTPSAEIMNRLNQSDFII
jgi:DNA polymerase gamma 1